MAFLFLHHLRKISKISLGFELNTLSEFKTILKFNEIETFDCNCFNLYFLYFYAIWIWLLIFLA